MKRLIGALLLAPLLALAQELHVIHDERIGGAELAVKAAEIALFDGPDETVHEVLATEQLDRGPAGLAAHVDRGHLPRHLERPGARGEQAENSAYYGTDLGLVRHIALEDEWLLNCMA